LIGRRGTIEFNIFVYHTIVEKKIVGAAALSPFVIDGSARSSGSDLGRMIEE
jgi:hypothetical protein